MLDCQEDPQLSTMTRQGKIPNMLATVAGYELSMPVRMTVDDFGCPQPEVDEHGYVFALPAGRKISLSGEIT